ncbi:MAG: STAS domain-containing protein [Bacteroidota bacterium]
MRVEKNVDEKYTEIKLLEEKLDSRLAPSLKSEFTSLNAMGVHNFLLNLAEVKYVDSSGLSAILTANRLCNSVGGMLVLCSVNAHVEKLIKISHLDSVLNLLPTAVEGKEAIYMHEVEKEIQETEEPTE